MKTERIIWGLVFLFIGGVLLAENLGVINFQWEVIWRFWPLILIISGANLLLSGEGAATAGFVAIIITVGALVFIGYEGVERESSRPVWDYNGRYEAGKNLKSSVFSEDFTPGLKHAELNISGGATEYVLKDSTQDLFKAEVKKRVGNYSLLKTTKHDSIEVLNFKMSGKQNWNMKDFGGNKAILMLNTAPEWVINLEVGAGKVNFDLRPFKVGKIHFEGGASSFKVKLGAPQVTTLIDVDTGASEIEISIPKYAACKINVDSGLSSDEFHDFIKQEDGSYETAGFDASTKKILINLEGGLSKFEVNRY